MKNNLIAKQKVLGIDLGTTFTVVAILEGSLPIIIPNSEGSRTTPSVVAYNEFGDVLVGDLAKRQSILNPKNTFNSAKRLIGRKYSEIKKEKNFLSYDLIENDQSIVKIVCPVTKKEFYPEEISASVLKKVSKDASKYLNKEIKDVVITVPAYFNDSQRQATKDAGSIAGLNVLRIINEPTAAALAYGLNKKKNEIILIFDLGGGTLDVSILEVGEDVFEVLATAGDTFLGGDDFDRAIAKHILDDFLKTENLDLSKDSQALQRIVEASEKAKIELSSSQNTIINIPFVAFDPIKKLPKNISLNITREKFEKLITPLINKCKEPLETVLADSKLNKKNIDQVILVGGSTRVPCVKSLVKNVLNKPLNESVNPDEVVALGAAIQGGILAGELKDLILLDVTPLSLGVEIDSGLMSIIIPKNTKVPANHSEIFSTTYDYQNTVEIHVLQGERILANENKSLGVFKLDDIPSKKKGIPRIEVRFVLSADGLLSVTAKEENSGKEQSIIITNSSNVTPTELQRILAEAEQFKKTDKYYQILKIIYKYSFLKKNSIIYNI